MTSLTVTQMRVPSKRTKKLTGAEAAERTLKRKIGLVWALTVMNVLSFAPGMSVIPIPSTVGKGITQGSLPFALLIALTINRKIIFRPNFYLCLVSLLAIEAVLTALGTQYPRGTGYRTFRYVEFIAILWLLSPYFGRSDMLLMRCHLKTMLWVIGSVAVGRIISPGKAMQGGRLGGVIWPIAATQVAHYAAVTIGMVIILWLCGYMRGRPTLLAVAVSVTVLLLTHTRTALVGLIAGIFFSGLSLITATPRVRRLFSFVGGVAALAFAVASAQITSWMARGQGTSQISNLSGRTTFWGPLLAFPRTKFQEIFGFGLSNGTFNGLPVDSNWLISYQDQGLWGVTICALILLYLLIAACFQYRGVRRALVFFFAIYCLVASFTEDGITNVSTYMLDITVAASLLAASLDSDRAQGSSPIPTRL